MTNIDDIKQLLKKFHNDDTKKFLKVSLIMLPKQFKKFCNDDTKKFNKVP